MNRRTILAFAFISVNLMACCCGGVGPSKQPAKAVAAHAEKIDPEAPLPGETEQQRFDRINAAARQKALDEAAKLQAIEDAKPKVTRVNYNRLYDNISLAEAQGILGPAKELSSGGGFQTVSWSAGVFGATVTATFHNGRLKSKAIIGD